MDCSDRERLAEAREELFGILEDDEMKGVPVVIMANKQDLPGLYWQWGLFIVGGIFNYSTAQYLLWNCRSSYTQPIIVMLIPDLCFAGAMKPYELIEGLCLRKLLDHKWHVQGTCATNGEGIYESMDALAGLVKDFKKNSRRPVY